MKVASSHAPNLLISFEANFPRYQAEALISKLWVLNPFEEKEPLSKISESYSQKQFLRKLYKGAFFQFFTFYPPNLWETTDALFIG